jgi:hypothetical protein
MELRAAILRPVIRWRQTDDGFCESAPNVAPWRNGTTALCRIEKIAAQWGQFRRRS